MLLNWISATDEIYAKGARESNVFQKNLSVTLQRKQDSQENILSKDLQHDEVWTRQNSDTRNDVLSQD